MLLRMILEKDVSLDHSSLIPYPTSLTKRVQIFFQKSTKRRLAIIDLIRDCIFLIRFDSTCSLFFAAVILFYSLSVLRYLLCLFNVVISVITTSSNHARAKFSNKILLTLPSLDRLY